MGINAKNIPCYPRGEVLSFKRKRRSLFFHVLCTVCLAPCTLYFVPCAFMPFGQTSYPFILTGFEKKIYSLPDAAVLMEKALGYNRLRYPSRYCKINLFGYFSMSLHVYAGKINNINLNSHAIQV